MATIFYLQKELIILHHRVNVTCFIGKIQLSQVRNKAHICMDIIFRTLQF